MPGKPRRAPHFLPQIIHSRSLNAPISVVFYGIEFLLKKSIIATKMKENG
jgi:hypothetical protein